MVLWWSLILSRQVRVRLVEVGAVPLVFSHLNGTFTGNCLKVRNAFARRRAHCHRVHLLRCPLPTLLQVPSLPCLTLLPSALCQARTAADRERVKAERLVLRRSAAYFLARLSQNVELHDTLIAAGALDACMRIATETDLECQVG